MDKGLNSHRLEMVNKLEKRFTFFFFINLIYNKTSENLNRKNSILVFTRLAIIKEMKYRIR